MSRLLPFALILSGGVVASLLLPANLLFIGAVGAAVAAGVAAAELRRGAGPAFRAPVTIGR